MSGGICFANWKPFTSLKCSAVRRCSGEPLIKKKKQQNDGQIAPGSTERGERRGGAGGQSVRGAPWGYLPVRRNMKNQ